MAFIFKGNLQKSCYIHNASIDPNFFRVLNNPAPMQPDMIGIEQILSQYGAPTFDTGKDIMEFLSQRYQSSSDPSRAALTFLSTHDIRWTLERLASALYQVGNIRALLYLVEASPVKVTKRNTPTTIDVTEGEKVELFVEALGIPEPEFNWSHNTNNMKRYLMTHFRNYRQENVGLQRSELVINSVKLSDAGIYCCEVFSSCQPADYQQLIETTVNVLPRLNRQLNRLSNQQHSYSPEQNVGRLPSKGLSSTTSEKRVRKIALLIGEMNYSSSSSATLHPLRCPLNDIPKIADKLKSLSFEVVSLFDLDYIALKRAFETFSSYIDEDSYVVCYVSCHGFQTPDHQDNIIPVDAKRVGSDTPPNKFMSVHDIIEILQKNKPALNVLLFDFCRTQSNIPFEAKKFRPNTNNLIVFYTANPNRETYEYQNKEHPSQDKTKLCVQFVELIEKYQKGNDKINVTKFLTELANNISMYKIDERCDKNQIPHLNMYYFGDINLGDPAIEGDPLFEHELQYEIDDNPDLIEFKASYSKALNWIELVVSKHKNNTYGLEPYFGRSSIAQIFRGCDPKKLSTDSKEFGDHYSSMLVTKLERLVLSEVMRTEDFIPLKICLIEDGKPGFEDCSRCPYYIIVKLRIPLIIKWFMN